MSQVLKLTWLGEDRPLKYTCASQCIFFPVRGTSSKFLTHTYRQNECDFQINRHSMFFCNGSKTVLNNNLLSNMLQHWFLTRTMQQPLTCFERLPINVRDQLPIKRKINDIFELIGEEFRCSPNRNLIVHVYQGANEAGHQWYPFHRATNILNMEKVSILYCNIKMVKDNLWNPKTGY